MVRRRSSTQTREERQAERDQGVMIAIGVLMLAVGLFAGGALVLAMIEGTAPDRPWLPVALLGAIVGFLGFGLQLVSSRTEKLADRLVMVGAITFFGGLALWMLLTPGQVVASNSRRAPDSELGARIFGVILAVPAVVFSFVEVSRWRRRR